MEREGGTSDVWWKTVPQTSGCNRKRSVADSGQTSTSNVQRRWWGRIRSRPQIPFLNCTILNRSWNSGMAVDRWMEFSTICTPLQACLLVASSERLRHAQYPTIDYLLGGERNERNRNVDYIEKKYRGTAVSIILRYANKIPVIPCHCHFSGLANQFMSTFRPHAQYFPKKTFFCL